MDKLNFSNSKKPEETKVEVTCDCGCTKIVVIKDYSSVSGEALYYFSTYEDAFLSHQNKVKEYFKRLWSALIGKDYHLYELILIQEEYNKLKF